MKLKFNNIQTKVLGLMALVFVSISACKQSDDFQVNETTPKPSVLFVGLTNTNTLGSTGGQLIRYNANNTNQLVGAAVSITGLQTGESILAIDYRPATGILYGIGSTSRLYILNPLTGAARAVNSTPFTPTISGAVAGFDFNPTVDRIRLITRSGQNLRLNPDDGTVVATDANINGVSDAILAEAAYTNNFSGATTTELYNLDIFNARLYKQDANAGTLTTVGSIGLRPITISTATTNSTAYNTNITNFRNSVLGGFDIAPSGEGLAVFTNQNGASPAIPVGGLVQAVAATPTTPAVLASPSSAVNAVLGNPTLFRIDLTTGKATDYGVLPLPAPVGGVAATALIGIAAAPAPVAYAIDDTNNSLMIFNPTKPEPITKAITGLQANESIVGLDMRPVNGQLYGLGNSSRVYVINPASGVATAVGTLPLVPVLSGTAFGFEFNPITDVIRIISNTGQNLRVNPTTGVATADPLINTTLTGDIELTAAAHSNNLVPTTSSNLFVMNTKKDSLYRVSTPDNGRITRIGKLNVSADAANGFDIGAVSGVAYAILTKGTETRIYTINTNLGSATPGLVFPKKVRGFTIGLGF